MARRDCYNRRDDYQNCWYKSMCEKSLSGNCTEPCVKFHQTDFMFQLSNLPRSMWKAIKLDESSLKEESAEFLNTLISDVYYFVKKGFNLYLYGEPGTGKTSWAVKIMNNYFAKMAEKNSFTTRGLFVSVPTFLRDARLYMTYKSNDFMEYLQDISKCDIVIWDDIYQTDNTCFEAQWLYSFVNERIFSNKCNIFTSNVSPKLLATLDPRMSSRICVGSDCIEITGPDFRYTKTYSYDMNNWEDTTDGTDTSAE